MTYENIKHLKGSIDVYKILQLLGFSDVTEEGDWYKTKCPYHDDTNPSFNVHKTTTYYHCWGCKKNGDIITLVMNINKFSFKEAVSYIKNSCNVTSTTTALDFLVSKWKEKNVENKDIILPIQTNKRDRELLQRATKFFRLMFHDSVAEKYVTSRGISDSVAINFCLGYYPNNDAFISKCYRNNYTTEDLIRVGLLSNFGTEHFRGRLICPIINSDGHVVAFTTRTLDESEPKYLNTQNTIYYKKSEFLYGQHLPFHDAVFLVEGNFDVLKLRSLGYSAVALTGGNLSNSQTTILKTVSNVVVCMDGDTAGKKATEKCILKLAEAGVKAEVILLNELDPAEVFVDNVVVDALVRMHPATALLTIGSDVCALLGSCKNLRNGIKNYYAEGLAKVLAMSKESVLAEMR